MSIYLLSTDVIYLIFDEMKDNTIYFISIAHIDKRFYELVIDYSYNNSIVIIPDCKYAALTNRLELLRWARDLKIHWNSSTLHYAANKAI